MGGKKKTIPELRTEAEAREFFDRHSTVDFLEETLPEQLTVDPDLKERLTRRSASVCIRQDKDEIAVVRKAGRWYT